MAIRTQQSEISQSVISPIPVLVIQVKGYVFISPFRDSAPRTFVLQHPFSHQPILQASGVGVLTIPNQDLFERGGSWWGRKSLPLIVTLAEKMGGAQIELIDIELDRVMITPNRDQAESSQYLS